MEPLHRTAAPAPVSRYLECAGRELHLLDWGPADAPVVVAWHGLARTGRDMDDLAVHLSGQGQWRVLCPDTIGRGLSQWSPLPQAEYCLAFYERLAAEMLDQLRVGQCHWVGTSMGGALGLVAATGRLRGRIGRLVMNDIGPQLEAPAVQRIRTYAAHPPVFDTVLQLEAFFRAAYHPFGDLNDRQWRRLTETSLRRLSDGRVTPHYDPAIVGQFAHHPHDYDRWPEWDRLDIPTLVLRGADSDLLGMSTVETMLQRRPHTAFRSVEGCGHAPGLHTPEQWSWVSQFLEAPL